MSFRSEKETSLKQELEESYHKFSEFLVVFIQKNRTKLDLNVYDHFQIDEHREKLKEKIYSIAFDIIDKTKK
jgi:hypothetical protein